MGGNGFDEATVETQVNWMMQRRFGMGISAEIDALLPKGYCRVSRLPCIPYSLG
jgi:hypothetical protein